MTDAVTEIKNSAQTQIIQGDMLSGNVNFNNKLFHTLYNMVPLGVSIATDVSCKEIIHNPVAAKFLRIEPWQNFSHSVPDKPPVKIFYKGRELSPGEMPIQRSAWLGEEVVRQELEFVWKDGISKTALWSSKPVYDEKGLFVGVVATLEDATEKEEVLKKLKDSEERYRAIFENSMDGIILTCTDGRIISANPALCQMLGYTEAELCALGRNSVVDLTDPRLPAALEERKRTGAFQGELLLIRKDGTKIQVGETCKVFQGGDGSSLTSTILRDITEKKRIDQELNRYRRRLQNLVAQQVGELQEKNELIELAHDAIIVCDLNGRITSWNKGAEELYGWAYFEVLGKNLQDLLDSNFPNFAGIKQQVLLSCGRWDGEIVHKRKDGKKIFVYSRQVVKRNIDGKPAAILEIDRNITDEKMALKALRESEERFSKAFEMNPFPMVITAGWEGRFINVNKSFLTLLGYKKEEVTGTSTDNLNIFYDEDWREFGRCLSEKGKCENLEVTLKTKSGAKRICIAYSDRIQIAGDWCILAILYDITEKKRYENELERLDRLNLIGEMASSIAHEIRNPLSVVRGFLQLMQEKEARQSAADNFDLMINELDRANSIISEYLSLARNKLVEFQTMNLNNAVKGVCPLIEADAIKSDKEIFVDLGDIPDILLDGKEIRQLILNLVRNGLEAMPSGGTLYLKTYFTGKEVVLEVEDGGIGIPNELVDKIGQPFVTSKENGTGLGLSVCFRICERHNAKIDFKTSGDGTTFYVRFPVKS